MPQSKKNILGKAAIAAKIERMAYEVAEQNAGAASIILAGIAGNGTVIAGKLAEKLKDILPVEITILSISLNKKKPEAVTISPEIQPDGQTIIITDDVSMTGRTMMYALKPLLNAHPAKIQTLVLVERQQKLFPMHSDYVGLHISTSLDDIIIVETEGEELTGAYVQ